VFDFIGKVREYHGGMSMDERNAAIEGSRTFTEGKQDVLLIQLHAGGTGLNLQHYDRVVFTSPWWTAALLDQALGRALRIGQKNVVQVYWLRLQSESIFNIDEFVLEKSETKRELANTFHTWSIQI
jgi:SNF2 family DNA or RNA helicase